MTPPSQLVLATVDEKLDHVRGTPGGPLILEYGDYECPYSRQAFHAIEQIEHQQDGNLQFAFRHFPLASIHPHALAAAAAAEAAALQSRFWEMHELLFHRQKALEDDDLRGYAAQFGLDITAFDRDRASTAVADRIRRDVDSGLASGQVLGTPTLFIGGVVYRGGYDPPTLLAALTSRRALRNPGLREYLPHDTAVGARPGTYGVDVPWVRGRLGGSGVDLGVDAEVETDRLEEDERGAGRVYVGGGQDAGVLLDDR